MTGDTFLGRQDFAKYVARIYPTITEESKVAFANWVHSTPTRIDRTKWWMDAYHPVRKLNHWGRLDLVDKILADEADLAIAARPDALSSKLEFASLQQVPLVFIAPRAAPQSSQWFSQGEPDWERLPLILSEQGLARKRCDQWFRNKGIAPNIYAEVAGNEGIVAMVALGFGVGLVPAAVIDHSPMGDKVRIVEPKPALKPFDVGIAVLKKRLEEPLIRAFWDTARGQGGLR